MARLVGSDGLIIRRFGVQVPVGPQMSMIIHMYETQKNKDIYVKMLMVRYYIEARLKFLFFDSGFLLGDGVWEGILGFHPNRN